MPSAVRGRRAGPRRRRRRARPSGPARSTTISSVLIAPRISSRVTEPRWPSRKILPVSLPWPPARTTPRRLTSPLNAFQSRPSGTCAAVTVREAWRWSANSSKPSAAEARPRRGGAGLVAGEDAGRTFLGHEAQALVDLVDDRDRRRERRLAVGRGVAMGAQVEVEARHRRRLHRRPGARRGRDHRQAGAAIQAFCEPVTTTSTPQASISNGTAPSADTLSTRMSASGALLADRRGQLGDRVHDPGRGLVVGQQHGLDRRGIARESLADLVGRRGIAPLGIELRHVRAVDAGDLGEPVAERPDAHAEHAVAGRQDVDDRGLEPARSRRS